MRELHNIGAVRAVGAFAVVIAILVVIVEAGPLEVHVVVLTHNQVLWHKVVLHRWVRLNNVAALAAHIQIENTLAKAQLTF